MYVSLVLFVIGCLFVFFPNQFFNPLSEMAIIKVLNNNARLMGISLIILSYLLYTKDSDDDESGIVSTLISDTDLPETMSTMNEIN